METANRSVPSFVRIPRRHQHRHVSTAGNTRQIDAVGVDLVMSLGPGHGVEDILLRRQRPAGERIVVGSTKIGEEADPPTLASEHFQQGLTLFEIGAPRV